MRVLPEFGWVSAGILTPVVAVLRAEGRDVDPVLDAGGVSERELENPTHRVTVQAATRVWQAALREVPDPAFGVRAALLVDAGDLDLLASLGRCSETLAEALSFSVRFGRLVDETLACRLEQTNDGCFFSLGPRSVHYLPAVAEYVLLRLVLMGQKALGGERGLLEVHFAHHRPSNVDYLRDAFKAVLRFERREVGVLFEPRVLSVPVATADRTTKRVLVTYAEQLLREARPSISTAQRVRDTMVGLLPDGFPARARVAERLGVNERTLVRALVAEGTNYSSLVEELRIELAFRRLQEGRLAIGDVATELGFQDQSAFTKFFKRHAGERPLDYRRKYAFTS